MSDHPTTIAFATDYGLADPFVGVCHAVIASIAPDTRVIDLSHGVPAHDVRAGALLLADSVAYLPPAVLLAVVDPGVGTGRRGMVIAAGPGDAAPWLLVGPDNGLLIPAAAALGGIAGAWELQAEQYRLQPVSATFHGRDIFAPAAAHLTRGVEPAALGPALAPDALVELGLPEPTLAGDRIDAEVLQADGFGNLELNLCRADLEQLGADEGVRVTAAIGGRRHLVVLCRAFGDLPSGALGLLEDSVGRMAITINGGSARDELGVEPGAAVTLHLPT